jgi:hypothetical protein
MRAGIFGLLLLVCARLPSYAHEPLFGVGPHTVYQHGLGLESEIEFADESISLHNEVLYGLTTNLAMTVVAPWIWQEQGDRASSGLGDISLRAKWRFLRRDSPGMQDALALIFGAKLPTGDEQRALPLGSGSTDLFGGIAAGRESRRWYYFGDLRYRVDSKANGLKRGNVFSYDAAWGIRPVLAPYEQPDLVLLLEANGKVVAKVERDDMPNPNSGGHLFSISPGFLLSIRNVMLKGGINVPILWDLNGVQDDPKAEILFGIEFHI